MFLLESGIGILIVFIYSLGLIAYLVFKIKSKLKYLLFSLLLLSIILPIQFINNTVKAFHSKPNINFQELEKKTRQGNFYVHDTTFYGIEDGKYIGLYICEKELKDAWGKISSLAFYGLDKNGQNLKKTLYRFLTSLDLRKDAQGLSKLTDDNIRAIEDGVANYKYIEEPGIKTRIHKILIGYKIYIEKNDPNGNSLIQRLEYWKASLHIIKNNFWTGVGTGDIRPVFSNYYEERGSKLKPENWGISHNQYLTVFVSFGIFGFLLFMIALLYPLHLKSIRGNYYYVVFLCIFLTSMLFADTIKNQAGITFYAFFNALLLFGNKSKVEL